MAKITEGLKGLILEVLLQVLTGKATKWEGATLSGWRLKAYRVGTYYRMDVFPPEHGGGK